MALTARRILRAARSPRYRGYAARAVTAMLLLLPLALLTLDHHGAERLPSHTHAVPAGQQVPKHLHGFEVAHVDAPGHTATVPEAPAVVPPEPAAVLVLSFVQGLGVPLARPILLAAYAQERAAPSTDLLADQTTLDPPTRPPTVVS
jgi:hypothetical protein